MANGNTVTLIGNVTRDPELRFTPSGQGVASFGLAVNRRWQNRQNNEWEEATSFFNVVCWREMAENVAESITKGARIVVTGRLEQRSWETDQGEKRSVVEVAAFCNFTVLLKTWLVPSQPLQLLKLLKPVPVVAGNVSKLLISQTMSASGST